MDLNKNFNAGKRNSAVIPPQKTYFNEPEKKCFTIKNGNDQRLNYLEHTSVAYVCSELVICPPEIRKKNWKLMQRRRR